MRGREKRKKERNTKKEKDERKGGGKRDLTSKVWSIYKCMTEMEI